MAVQPRSTPVVLSVYRFTKLMLTAATSVLRPLPSFGTKKSIAAPAERQRHLLPQRFLKYVFHGHSHQCRDHCNEAVGNGLYFVCCRFADIKPSLGLARPTVNSGTHPKSSVRLREMKSMTGLHRIVMAVAAVALAEAVDRVVVLAALVCWLSTSLFRGWPTEVFRRLQSASM
jgi:hypothetical protein